MQLTKQYLNDKMEEQLQEAEYNMKFVEGYRQGIITAYQTILAELEEEEETEEENKEENEGEE